MRKICLLSLGLCFFVADAFAYDVPGLYANFKRVGLDLGTSKVSNYREYEGSPNTEINQNTQGVLKGVFEFAFEYEQPKYRWDNSIYTEYGKSKIHGNPGRKSHVENADKILLASDYTYKIWHLDSNNADIGPFANVAYQTEFTADADAKRQNLMRFQQGLKLINGTYGITDFHLAMVEEWDTTYKKDDTKTAWQIGMTYKYPFAEKYRFEFETYYRDYMSYSRYEATDFRYEWFAIAKLNVKVHDKFFVEPYASYFRADDRKRDKAASSLVFGVAVAYSEIFDL
ncbi:MAG: DUF3078 domain-containing protein [Alphaproteobacteria bacterium]|nr:DUF3078 domain-containing protein [Alphaproteobacteria bacterium]